MPKGSGPAAEATPFPATTAAEEHADEEAALCAERTGAAPGARARSLPAVVAARRGAWAGGRGGGEAGEGAAEGGTVE